MQAIRFSSYRFGSQMLGLADTEKIVALLQRIYPGIGFTVLHGFTGETPAQWREKEKSETSAEAWDIHFPAEAGFDLDGHRAGAIAQAFWFDSVFGFQRLINLGREGNDLSIDEWMLEQTPIREAIVGRMQSLLFGPGSPANKPADAGGVVRI